MTPVLQFRLFIVRPALTRIGLWSEPAEDLVVGTALHESGGLRFLEQITGKDDTRLGPALGYFQMERPTHDDIWNTFLKFRPDLAARVQELAAPWPDKWMQLCTNLSYATAMCRMRFYRSPEPLPKAGDIDGYAEYWKQNYNTFRGKGTPAQWSKAYRAHCL